MKQRGLRAVFMRGGTSKAVIFRAEDLPRDRAEWDRIFLAVIGSPDPNGRQLDGMGGGISSLSKVCVIGPPSRPDADIDYTFAQVSVANANVDYSANCGNMSSAVGPFAVDEKLVHAAGDEAVVTIHNTNTRKLIVARFPLDNGLAAADGDFILPGVAGSGAPIRLDFLEPGGAGTGRLLPTGHTLDLLDVPEIGRIEASMVDAANPCVFVAAAALGCSGIEMPAQLEANRELLMRLEAIRVAASLAMGIARTPAEAARKPGSPKVAMIAGPCEAPTLSGERLTSDAADVTVRGATDLLGLAPISKPTGRIPQDSVPQRSPACCKAFSPPIRLRNPGLSKPAATCRSFMMSGLQQRPHRSRVDVSRGLPSLLIHRGDFKRKPFEPD